MTSSGGHRARLAERAETARRLVVLDPCDLASVGAGEDDLRILRQAQLLDDPGHVVGLHAEPMAVVDRDDRRPAAAAEALDGPEREGAVLGGRARLDAELALEVLEHLLCAGKRARDVRADLDQGAARRLEPILVVEGRDREAVRRGQIERVGDLAERLRGEPASVLLLCEPKRRHDRGEGVGITLAQFPDLRPRRS